VARVVLAASASRGWPLRIIGSLVSGPDLPACGSPRGWGPAPARGSHEAQAASVSGYRSHGLMLAEGQLYQSDGRALARFCAGRTASRLDPQGGSDSGVLRHVPPTVLDRHLHRWPEPSIRSVEAMALQVRPSPASFNPDPLAEARPAICCLDGGAPGGTAALRSVRWGNVGRIRLSLQHTASCSGRVSPAWGGAREVSEACVPALKPWLAHPSSTDPSR